jgi:hypothetical protein
LLVPGIFPYCAMMQIAAEDTRNDYVLCRGFDVRDNRFVDYPPGIPVGKPFGKRTPGVYEIAQIYPAVLPLQTDCSVPSTVPWRVGQNPGVAATTQGHPADLNETVGILYDDNGNVINWMLVDSGESTLIAEATLVGSVCGTDGETAEVTDAKLLPNCTDLDLTDATITNTMRHMGPAGSKVRLIKSCASGSGSGSGSGDVWDITEIEKRPLCVVHEVKDSQWCLTQIVVKVAAEWCEDPDSACVVVLYTDCSSSGDCDTSISFSADTCCANEPGSGSGSGV